MTTRSVFISYEGGDRNKAKGFRLLRWNKNVDVTFNDRHLLDPVDSTNDKYIRDSINSQLKGTSVTAVLIGENTKTSEWVDYEIQRSIDRGNGLIAIRLPGIGEDKVPDSIPENGGEVIEWEPHEFGDAIERAAMQRSKVGQTEVRGRVGSGCGRS